MLQREILTRDHVKIQSTHVTRLYFGMLLSALSAAEGVIEGEINDGLLEAADKEPLLLCVKKLQTSMSALFCKYRMSGLIEGPLKSEITIDVENSGYPIAQEVISMATDVAGAHDTLLTFATEEKLKAEMLREILTKAKFPARLRNVMSQRQYYEIISQEALFTPRMMPVARAIKTDDPKGRTWRVDWAVYDTQMNLPIVYMMDIRDTGRIPMTDDPSVWPMLCQHIMAQSISSLSPDTIVRGIDLDFKKLHPTRLRRMFLGPFYAHEFTVQEGSVNTALLKAGNGAWALSMLLETVVSNDSKFEGFFTRTEIQEYGQHTANHCMVAPVQVFQSIQDHARQNFEDAQKYVLEDNKKVRRRG